MSSTVPDADRAAQHASRPFRISFAPTREGEANDAKANPTASQQYDLSVRAAHTSAQSHEPKQPTPRSPLYPPNIIFNHDQPGEQEKPSIAQFLRTRDPMRNPPPPARDGMPLSGTEKDDDIPLPLNDPASGAILIYPHKIDNLRRFRILFVGVLLFISCSTQGIHSIFGLLCLQEVHNFSVRDMVIVYLSGISVGMFAFPFGVLYDWFGPRVVVALGSAIASLGHLLFALAFAGHIDITLRNCALFYAIMCWGCYALEVAVMPAVLTHMPRDRGQPTGLLQTFSGLGSSFFACLFRGFFQNNFSNLMWLMFAVTLSAGVAGVWYLEDAPYVVNRWRQRRITPREQLRAYLIRNRYMSQLVPKRRYLIMTAILVLLNFYLTIQTVCVAYLPAHITPGKLRGIALGSIGIVLMVLILVVPLESIDGMSEQDKQVIEAAKEKEEELRALQEERYRRQREQEREELPHSTRRRTSQGSVHTPFGGESEKMAPVAGDVDKELRLGRQHRVDKRGAGSGGEWDAEALPVESKAALRRGVSKPKHRAEQRGGVLSNSLGLPLYEPARPERPLVQVFMESSDDEGETPRDKRNGRHHNATLSGAAGEPGDGNDGETHEPCNESFRVRVGGDGDAAFETSLSDFVGSFDGSEHLQLRRSAPSTFKNPRVETITLCGEVYVVPVYQTTFLQSLTYLDMWLIFYTTLCVWGIGLVMTGNWNIEVMVRARFGGMQYKHYILFAAMCGLSVAGGRVFLGLYETVLQLLRERTGTVVVPTLIYPITSVGLFIGLILWMALPGDKALVLAYLIAPGFYGMSTSVTFYVLGTIFDRDIGMLYGFCHVAAGIGFVLCYWCSWYLTYEREASPLLMNYCVGERRCMNRAVIIYLVLSFTSIFTSYIVHRRYAKLVHGQLAQRRVIVPRIQKVLAACGCCKGDTLPKETHANEEESSTP